MPIAFIPTQAVAPRVALMHMPVVGQSYAGNKRPLDRASLRDNVLLAYSSRNAGLHAMGSY